MKRSAERQISKDDVGEELEEDGPGRGFQLADEKALAGRKIRGLPKRALQAAAAPATAPAPAPIATPTLLPTTSDASSKFPGFGGFGAPGATSQFTFSAPAFSVTNGTSAVEAQPATTPATVTTSAFSTSATQSAFSSPTAPPVATTASNATKQFASFLSQPPSQPEPKPTVTEAPKIEEKPKLEAAVPSEETKEPEDEELKAETEYLTNLRGLNESLIAAVSKAIQSDPFADIANLLERYKQHRTSIQSTYDEALKKVKPSTSISAATTTAPVAPPSAPSSGVIFGKQADSKAQESPATPPPSMPQVPTSFTGFPTASTSTSTSTPSGCGFTPKLDAIPPSGKSDVLKFPPSASTSAATSAFTAGASSGFKPFGTPSSATSSAFGTTSSTSAFGGAPSVWASDLFTKQPDKPKGEEKEKEKEKAATDGTSTLGKGFPSTFGTSSFGTPAFGSGVSAFSTPDKSKSSAFGTTGFNFGGEASTSASGFTPFAPVAKPAEKEAAGGEGEALAEEAPSLPKGLATSVHDQEGEGEENEETLHEVRSKVFKLVKKSEGGQEWADQGVGVLRLKRHKETDARRLLLRNSSTGKIVINFNLHKGMNTSVAKNVVSFLGHDYSDTAESRGAATPYKVRIKVEKDAVDLKNALEREIQFVRGKSE